MSDYNPTDDIEIACRFSEYRPKNKWPVLYGALERIISHKLHLEHKSVLEIFIKIKQDGFCDPPYFVPVNSPAYLATQGLWDNADREGSMKLMDRARQEGLIR